MAPQHRKPLKSFILSAGFGTRLRPLTDHIPKPLATILDIPLFDLAALKCASTGSHSLAVNTHHLFQVMESHCHQKFQELGFNDLFISREWPNILGTGGAFSPLKNWWGDSSLLVYNGDILSDLRLCDLVTTHGQGQCLVTMAVRPATGLDRSVWTNQNYDVKFIGKVGDLPAKYAGQPLLQHSFACAYVTEPEILRYLPQVAEFFDIVAAFNDAIFDGKIIKAVPTNGFWADVGNPKALWAANLDVANMANDLRYNLLGCDASSVLYGAGEGARSVSVVSRHAKVGNGASIKNSVLLPGGEVSPGEVVVNALRGLGLNLVFD